MDAQALKKAWLHVEQEQASFIGWDFSYLDGKYEQEPTPWRYEDLVRRVLTPDMHLLDMGTGGGERLATFHHPWHLVSVTEGWDRNYRLLLETLRPKGVDVQFVGDDQCLNFADHSFDIVLNAHEAFQISEVR
ncbi:MAG: class I SAM-dependent methyltransferase, partial [Eubacteriales bacterium]|nr:class I SAM-dependent methyltransferase [Eubacteriales bacterium]